MFIMDSTKLVLEKIKLGFKVKMLTALLTVFCGLVFSYGLMTKNVILLIISGYPFIPIGSLSTSLILTDFFSRIKLIITHFWKVKWLPCPPPEYYEIAEKMNFGREIKIGLRSDIETAYAFRNTIVINSSLFIMLHVKEMQSVFSHEITHIKNRHSTKGALLMYVPMVVIVLGLLALPPLMRYIAVSSAAIFVMMPISWYFEYQADGEAAKIVGKEYIISAIRKISLGKDITEPSMSHPSISSRIEVIQSL